LRYVRGVAVVAHERYFAEQEELMSGRVDWGSRDGNEVEAVIANLLYNKDGRAVRVRPGQGDFGIDVILPATENSEPWDVYQVKKYAANLSSSQKTKIVESFSRLLIGLVREGLPINDWYLVTPLDPTVIKDLRGWFNDLPESAISHAKKLKKEPLTTDEEAVAREWLGAPGRKIEWKGLPFCDNLAARYWYVVDYYLHGGRDRIRDATDSLAGLLAGDMKARKQSDAQPGDGAAALLEPSEIVDHLALLDSVLDTDPHFTYGHGISPTLPAIQHEPGLVAATIQSLPSERWLFFKIYQRSAQSLEERPIPIHLEFTFAEGTPEHEAYERWKRYGKPFQAPARFSLDLPGGLGAEDREGTVSIPAPYERDGYQLRMRVVGPDGTTLAELEFAMRSTAASDRTGAWTTGTDPSGVMDNEGFIEKSPEAMQRVNFTLAPLGGQVAAAVQPAVRFARHLEAPNKIQIAGSVGMFNDMIELDSAQGMVPPSIDRFIASLATIQTRTNHVIRIPDIAEVTDGEVRDIHRAARLIDGDTYVGKWRREAIEGVAPGAMEVGEHIQIQLDIPLRVKIEEEILNLGTVEQTILSATVVEIDDSTVYIEPNLNDTGHERLVDGPQGGWAPAGKTAVRARRCPTPNAEPTN
jgi:hypothetical protein